MEPPLVPRPGDLVVLTHHHVLSLEQLGVVLVGDVVLGAERFFLDALLDVVVKIVVIINVVIVIIIVVVIIILFVQIFVGGGGVGGTIDLYINKEYENKGSWSCLCK